MQKELKMEQDSSYLEEISKSILNQAMDEEKLKGIIKTKEQSDGEYLSIVEEFEKEFKEMGGDDDEGEVIEEYSSTTKDEMSQNIDKTHKDLKAIQDNYHKLVEALGNFKLDTLKIEKRKVTMKNLHDKIAEIENEI